MGTAASMPSRLPPEKQTHGNHWKQMERRKNSLTLKAKAKDNSLKKRGEENRESYREVV